MPIRIASAQLNQVVGDVEGNRGRIASAAQRAHEAGAQVLVTPELSLTGYPPEDLLLRGAFYDRTRSSLAALVEQSKAWPTLRLVVGHPSEGCVPGQRLQPAVGALLVDQFEDLVDQLAAAGDGQAAGA